MSQIDACADDAHDVVKTTGVSRLSRTVELVELARVPATAWRDLAENAVEPNAFYDPAWAWPAAQHARGHNGARALLSWDGPQQHRLLGLLPVVSASRALTLPLPVLVGWQAYARLSTPLLRRDAAEEAALGLIDAAGAAGMRALLLPDITIESPAALALQRALATRGIALRTLHRHERARLDATGDAETKLRTALGAKKLKELRRQRHRLADKGNVSFEIASSPAAVAAALEHFLVLEAQGWKGRRGTALIQDPGDARFIRVAAAALAAEQRFEVVTLIRNGLALAAGLVLRHGRRAYFFKFAYDETEAKTSPGVQLTLDLTRHLCDDACVDDVDSTADADHPMIDHIWRERLTVADVLVPTRANDPLVPAIQTVIAARDAARKRARRIVNGLRAIKERMR